MKWQKILQQGFSTVNDLLNYLEIPSTLGSVSAEHTFPTRIPLGFAKRMQKANPKDPLLLQVLASPQELEIQEGYTQDPLQETGNPIKGLLHKYHGRVLLTLTGVCAINCRYCFRRHFPYPENNPGRHGRREIYQYIAENESISEVILSGGDPLLASDIVLRELLHELEQIKHVHTVRIHTRIPIVLPERINEQFLGILKNTRLKKVLVLHCNHPQELDEHIQELCEDLREIGCVLLNQSVLLRDINDEASILIELSHKLFAYGILPYYLHVLDKVQGASHFDIPLEDSWKLYREIQNHLPGYLLPRLVKEEPGKKSKTVLSADMLIN